MSVVTGHVVFVAVGPLPADKGDNIRIRLITGGGIALAYGFHRVGPHARGQALRMIIDTPEIQRGTIACKVASIRWGNNTAALHCFGVEYVGIDRIICVAVQVAEQYLRCIVTPYNQLLFSRDTIRPLTHRLLYWTRPVSHRHRVPISA